MKPRLIGVDTCDNCKRIRNNWTQQGVDFEYWDGDADEIQDDLDKMKVKKFPVIQIVGDDGKTLYTWDQALYPRGVAYKTVVLQMEKLKNVRH